MNKKSNSPKPIFSPDIIAKYKNKLNEIGIVDDDKGIVKLIKKHENLKNPRILSYVQPQRPVNPITVAKLLSKIGLNNEDVEKKIAQDYQRLLIENVILQEHTLIEKKALESRLEESRKKHTPMRLIFHKSSSSSSSSSSSPRATRSTRLTRTRSPPAKRSRSARRRYVPV